MLKLLLHNKWKPRASWIHVLYEKSISFRDRLFHCRQWLCVYHNGEKSARSSMRRLCHFPILILGRNQSRATLSHVGSVQAQGVQAYCKPVPAMASTQDHWRHPTDQERDQIR